MNYPLGRELLQGICDLKGPNDDLVNLDTLTVLNVGDVSTQSQLGHLSDYMNIAISICEVVDQINSLSPLTSLLKSQ